MEDFEEQRCSPSLHSSFTRYVKKIVSFILRTPREETKDFPLGIC